MFKTVTQRAFRTAVRARFPIPLQQYSVAVACSPRPLSHPPHAWLLEAPLRTLTWRQFLPFLPPTLQFPMPHRRTYQSIRILLTSTKVLDRDRSVRDLAATCSRRRLL